MWNEEELIDSLARGEEFALEILFEHHYEALWKYVLVILKNTDDAKEVVNETFFRAFRHARHYQGKGSFTGWLFRIARNLSIDYIKKRNNEIELLSDIPEKVINDPLKEKLFEELYCLKEKYREIIILKDMAGYSIKEISQIMGITTSAVKTLHHRAIKRLRDKVRHVRRET
ncbi:MAG TPA: RNA polymerase sigma factor [Candidatus Eremiobacteraeota bacterium]|nr:MAG: ECF RNA polymerase sigma factor SigE [bacterium ADurb.Bin363]HPZ09505.1 RNA polymerase sigma factor [Candidatus Eremiobacteraeota bacterium]